MDRNLGVVVALIATTGTVLGMEPGPRLRLRKAPASPVRREHSDGRVAQRADPEVVAPPKEEPSLSLSDLEAKALSNSPALLRTAARVEAAEGRYQQAGLYPNPRVGYRGEEIGNEDAAGMHGVFIGQEIVTAGKRRLSRNAAGQGVERAVALLEAQRLRVLNDVRRAYFDVLVAQRALSILGEAVRINDEALTTSGRLFQGEEISRPALLQSQIEARTARMQRQNATARLDSAWRQLSAVVGDPYMPAQRLVGDPAEMISDLRFDEAMSTLLASSPELAAATAAAERSRWTLSLARAEARPNVDVEGSIMKDDATGDVFGGVEVAVPLPLWNRNQGNIRAASAQLRAAEADVRRLQLRLHERLAVAFGDYEAARQQVEAYSQEILPDARESMEIMRQAFQNGEVGYLDVLTAQRSLLNATISYLEALRTLRRTAVAIEGLMLTGSLEADDDGMEESAVNDY